MDPDSYISTTFKDAENWDIESKLEIVVNEEQVRQPYTWLQKMAKTGKPQIERIYKVTFCSLKAARDFVQQVGTQVTFPVIRFEPNAYQVYEHLPITPAERLEIVNCHVHLNSVRVKHLLLRNCESSLVVADDAHVEIENGNCGRVTCKHLTLRNVLCKEEVTCQQLTLHMNAYVHRIDRPEQVKELKVYDVAQIPQDHIFPACKTLTFRKGLLLSEATAFVKRPGDTLHPKYEPLKAQIAILQAFPNLENLVMEGTYENTGYLQDYKYHNYEGMVLSLGPFPDDHMPLLLLPKLKNLTLQNIYVPYTLLCPELKSLSMKHATLKASIPESLKPSTRFSLLSLVHPLF